MSQRYLTATKYDLPPYSLHGIPYASLPPICQQFIGPFLNAPINLPRIRFSLAVSLVEQLIPIDTNIIKEYHTSTYYLDFMEALHEPHSQGLANAQMDEERTRFERISTLRARRQTVVTNFALKFDALLWLESNILTRQGLSVSKKDEQKFRKKMIGPYLEYAGDALPDLESAYLSAMSSINWQRPARDHFMREFGPYMQKFYNKVRSNPSRVDVVP